MADDLVRISHPMDDQPSADPTLPIVNVNHELRRPNLFVVSLLRFKIRDCQDEKTASQPSSCVVRHSVRNPSFYKSGLRVG